MKTADPTLLSDADFSVQVTPERAEKPASRWRNKWRALRDGSTYCSVCGDVAFVYEGGEFVGHCRVYPSQDSAETHANELDRGFTDARKYLGAHAVEGDA